MNRAAAEINHLFYSLLPTREAPKGERFRSPGIQGDSGYLFVQKCQPKSYTQHHALEIHFTVSYRLYLQELLGQWRNDHSYT